MIHSGLENGTSDMTKPFNLLTEKSLPLYQILASCWSGIGAYNRICLSDREAQKCCSPGFGTKHMLLFELNEKWPTLGKPTCKYVLFKSFYNNVCCWFFNNRKGSSASYCVTEEQMWVQMQTNRKWSLWTAFRRHYDEGWFGVVEMLFLGCFYGAGVSGS